MQTVRRTRRRRRTDGDNAENADEAAYPVELVSYFLIGSPVRLVSYFVIGSVANRKRSVRVNRQVQNDGRNVDEVIKKRFVQLIVHPFLFLPFIV